MRSRGAGGTFMHVRPARPYHCAGAAAVMRRAGRTHADAGSNGRGYLNDFRSSADRSGQKIVRLHLRVASKLRSERAIGM